MPKPGTVTLPDPELPRLACPPFCLEASTAHGHLSGTHSRGPVTRCDAEKQAGPLSPRPGLPVALAPLIQGPVALVYVAAEHKGILINTVAPKPRELEVTYLRVSSTVGPSLLQRESNSAFVKGCFPHGLRGFKEISNQLKGPPPNMGFYTTSHGVLQKIS